MIIPHRELSPDALHGVVEDFVTRDGTDYGESETALATKVAQVITQLDKGKYIILYDTELDSIGIVPKDQLLDGFEGAE
jgi:uncharacterized protein YheU (UPF0270 family)